MRWLPSNFALTITSSVLNRRCQLTHVDLYNRRETRGCYCCCCCSSDTNKWTTAWNLHIAFIALTLLVGRQEEHPVGKNWLMRCWCGCLSGARCRLFAYGPADATAIRKPLSLVLFQSRLVSPFWYRLTQVVLEKRPLNGSISSNSLAR